MRKDIFEIHKPSAMITADINRPIVKNKKIVGMSKSLLPIQHDAMNFLSYHAREQLHKQIDVDKKLNSFTNQKDIFDFLQVQEFSLNIKDFITFINSYQTSADKKFVFDQLKNLNMTQVELGIFKQDKMMGEIYAEKTMSLLRNFTRIKNSNVFSYQLEPEILLNWIANPKPFAKLFIKIQTKLKLTYSKILYEICKDYENLNKPLEKPFSEWILVLGINENSNTKTPGKLKAFYLKKAIKEINEFTDIFIDDIIGKKQNGKTTMIVKFHKQKCDLINNIFDELPIEEQIKYNKKRAIAEQRLEQSKQFQDIKDEEAWLKKTIHSITDEFLEQQELNKQFKEQIDNIDIKDYGESLMQMYGDVIGLKDYKLIYVFDETKPALTNNAQETYDILLKLDNEKEDEN